MDYLKEICKLCKCSVSVTINNHRDYYDTSEQYIAENSDRFDDVKPEVLSKMIELDTIIEVQVYPHTPIGFYLIGHYDLDSALKQAYDAIKG